MCRKIRVGCVSVLTVCVMDMRLPEGRVLEPVPHGWDCLSSARMAKGTGIRCFLPSVKSGLAKKNRMCWHISKWFLPPPPAESLRGSPSDIYAKTWKDSAGRADSRVAEPLDWARVELLAPRVLHSVPQFTRGYSGFCRWTLWTCLCF